MDVDGDLEFLRGAIRADAEHPDQFPYATRFALATVLNKACAGAWEGGWHEHYLEGVRQDADPSHPITKTNPFQKRLDYTLDALQRNLPTDRP